MRKGLVRKKGVERNGREAGACESNQNALYTDVN